MKVIITGGTGQLGKSVNHKLLANGIQTIILSKYNLDITKLSSIQSFFAKEKPDIVINCGAYTKVDDCESDVSEAYRVNALGPKYLAIASNEVDAKIVQISTDYVFSGETSSPYQEHDKTDPQTVYGCSKLLGEDFVRQFNNKHYIIRTAWLYGDGHNFVKTMLKLGKTKDTLSIVNDQIGTPTSTEDLSSAILDLIQTDYYGTYHGTCEGQCSWYDFAKKIFEISNIDVKLNPISSEEFTRPAKRPKYSVLENFMLNLIGLNSFNPWEKSIEDFLRKR